MDATAFDEDKILTDYLTDYADGTLDRAEKDAFEEYLDQNPREKEFARKSLKGKRALSMLASDIKGTNVQDKNFV